MTSIRPVRKRFPTSRHSPFRRSMPNVLWAGSADGLVHVTTDHGANWTAVTPPQLPQWAQISSIEPSHAQKGTAYLTASRYMWDDYHPYVYETTDYGAHWTTLTNGFPSDQYTFVVRQDPREPRLLFAGTRSTVYVSLDGGAQWQPLTLNLPGVQVRDLAIDVREGELVAATHGRAFWIMDNVALLEQLARQTAYSVCECAALHTRDGVDLECLRRLRLSDSKLRRESEIRRDGLLQSSAWLQRRNAATISFADASGATIRSFTLRPENKHSETDAAARRRISTPRNSASAISTSSPRCNPA